VYTLLEIIEIETNDDYYLNVNIYLFLETTVNLVLSYIMDLTIEVKHKFNYYFALLLLSLY